MRHFSGNNWTTQNLFKLSQINGIVHYHCMKKYNSSVFQIHPSIPRYFIFISYFYYNIIINRHFFHLITQKNPASESKSNKISVIKKNGFDFVSSLISSSSFDWPKSKSGVYKSSCYDMSDSYILSLYCYHMNDFDELINDNSFYGEVKDLYKEKQKTRLEKIKIGMKEDEYEKYVNEKVREKLLQEYNKYVMEKYEYNEIINKILPPQEKEEIIDVDDKSESVNEVVDDNGDDGNIGKETHPKFVEHFKTKKTITTTTSSTKSKENKGEKINREGKKKNQKYSSNYDDDNYNKKEGKESVNKTGKKKYPKQQQHQFKKNSNSKPSSKKSSSSSNRKSTPKTYKRSFHTSILRLDKEKDILNEIFNTNISITDEDIKSIKSMSGKMYGNEEDIFNEVMNQYPAGLGLTDEEKKEFMKELNQKVYEDYGISGDLNMKSNDEIAKDIDNDLEKLENEEDKKVLEKIKNGETVGNYDRLFNKYYKPKK